MRELPNRTYKLLHRITKMGESDRTLDGYTTVSIPAKQLPKHANKKI